MKNILLFTFLLLFGGQSSLFAQDDYISLNFARSGTDAASVTVSVKDQNGNDVSGASATVDECSHAWKTGGVIGETILCPSVNIGNATPAPTVTMTFTITGLPEGFCFNKMGLDIHPLNFSGTYQWRDTDRYCNIQVEESSIPDTSNPFATLSDVNITRDVGNGTGNTDNVHQMWDAVSDNVVSSNGGSLTLKFTVTRGASNATNGFFFGLSEIRLYKAEEEIAWSSLEEVAGSDYVCIVTDREDGKVLTEENNAVHLKTYEEGNDYQLWQIVTSGTQYLIRNKATGRYIDRGSNVYTNALPTTTVTTPKYNITSATSSTGGKPLYNFFHPDTQVNCWYYDGSTDKLQVAALTASAEGYAFAFFKPTFVAPAISLEEILAANHGLVYLYSNVAVSAGAEGSYLAAIPLADEDDSGNVVPVHGNNIECSDNSSGGYSHVWHFQAQEGGGYLLRSMNTGQYMRGPANSDDVPTVVNSRDLAGTYYVKVSEVEAATDRFVISSTADFAEGTCLFYSSQKIEGGYEDSANSAWKIEAATGFTLSQLEGILPEMPEVTPPAENGLAEVLAANNGLVYLYTTKVDTNPLLIEQNGSELSGSYYTSGKTAQIWQIQANGNGYTIRNMSSGRYLNGPDSNKEVSLNRTSETYYITNSEVDGYTDHYVISNTENFADGSCLYSPGSIVEGWNKGDQYSAWDIVAATDADYDQLLSDLEATLTGTSRYYKVKNNSTGHVITESWAGQIMTGSADEGLATQYWKFTQYGNKYTIQSVSSKMYVQADPGQSANFRLGTEEAFFTLQEYVDNNGTTHYGIRYEGTSGRGLHESSTQSNHIVSWDHTVDASRWILEDANLSEEQIAAIEAQYHDEWECLGSAEASAAFFSFFTDASTGELKSQYKSMSDTELRAEMADLHTVLQDIAIKVKNNAWTNTWDKHFRVAKYGAFTNQAYWQDRLQLHFYYGETNNPTGIVANSGEKVYIIVGNDIPSGAALRVHTRCRSNVAECQTGYHTTRQTVQLKKGVNVFTCSQDNSHIYIQYWAPNGTDIADSPKLDIHIEGGQLHGYVDINKHDDDDWVDMQSKGLFQADADNMVNLLGNYAQLYISATIAKKNGNNIIPLIEHYDWYVYTQLELMGLTACPDSLKHLPGAEEVYEDIYPKKFNNRMLCIGLSNGTLHGTQGHICLGSDDAFYYAGISNRGSNVWGAAHEYGHINQKAINMIACTERSNNLFANVTVYKGGTCTSRGVNLSKMQSHMANGTHSWFGILGGDTFHAAQMWYQLYLYYHAAGNNPFFYQKLFRLLRQDPLNPTPHAQGVASGTQDYLKFALKACEAANEDLTEFFDFWGFFVPVEDKRVNEYNYDNTVTTTQQEIDGVKADMAKYAKKGNAGMIFIEDRAVASYKPNGTQKDAFEDQTVDDCAAKLEGAQYSSFNGNKTYSDRLGYTLQGNYFTVNNTTGASGFKFYNSAGKLIYAASKDYFEIPTAVFQNIDHSKTVAALTDGTTLPLYNTDDNDLYMLNVIDATGTTSVRYTKGEDAAMLSKERDGNAIALLYDKNGSVPASAPVSLSEAENVAVGNTIHHLNLSDKYDYGFAQASNYTAENITYTDRLLYEGWNTLCLPFAITKADLGEGARIEVLDDWADDVLYFREVAGVAAGQPCLVWLPGENENWTCRKTETAIPFVGVPTLSSNNFYMNGNFEKKNIGAGHYKLNAAGTAFGVTTEKGVSYPFRAYVSPAEQNNVRTLRVMHGDSDNTTNLTAPALELQEGGACYDLQGRKVTNPKRGEIYILSGKKVFFK